MADNELKEMLKTVIQGELKPIHEQMHVMQNQIQGLDNRIQGMDNRIGGIENRMEGMDNRFQGMENRIDGMDNRIEGMQDQMNRRFDELHRSIEASDRDSINADEILLKHILELKEAVTVKTTTHDHQFNVVNQRLFTLESDVDQLKTKLA
ncbi:MAG TPA: hypothetical protein VGE40_15220 [Bacilli bacterium]